MSDRENKDNQREAALESYFDKMSDLLLKERLRNSADDAEVCSIAQARTTAVLRTLDPTRTAILIRFLDKSSLFDLGIGKNLESVDLCKTNLHGVKLRFVNLINANLSETILYQTDLTGALLVEAYLSGADL